LSLTQNKLQDSFSPEFQINKSQTFYNKIKMHPKTFKSATNFSIFTQRTFKSATNSSISTQKIQITHKSHRVYSKINPILTPTIKKFTQNKHNYKQKETLEIHNNRRIKLARRKKFERERAAKDDTLLAPSQFLALMFLSFSD
jgi:hypothetical protein